MRLAYSVRLSNEAGHRHYDNNGYLFVDESPILRAGVLEYYGQELIDGGSPDIDGKKVEPDKIYKVYISPEELAKGADSFKMLPLVNGHTWLGLDGEDAKDHQEGATGENVQIKGDKLYVPLMFTGDDILAELKSGKEELSASYTNKLIPSDNEEYDLIATDIKGNHIALVEKGRCGSDVRVLNQKNMEIDKMKSKNEIKLVIDGKEIDLAKFVEQEANEDAHKDTGAITDTDNDAVDKRALIDEIGGILKGKVDDELIRTIMEKCEKLSYDGSKATESDNKDPNDNLDKDDNKGDDNTALNKSCNSYDAIYAKLSNAFAKAKQTEQDGLKRAYNAASAVIGEFNPFGMSEREMLVKALNHKGIETDKESVAEMYAMLKVCNSTAKVDNGFDYGVNGKEEIEINV